MASEKITIYEVAAAAGVSISTVSRVLNDPSRVQEATRDSVLRAIQELGFIPKAEAIARARKRLYRIGIITPFFTEASFVQRIRGVSQGFSSSSYEVIIYTVKTAAQLKEYVHLLTRGDRVDGIIILSLIMEPDEADALRRSQLPVVWVENAVEGFSSIVVDNVRGGWLGADYLLGRGHRALGFLGEVARKDFTLQATEDRLQGFLSRLSDEGLSPPEEWVLISEFHETRTDAWIRSLLESPDRPRALMCASDILAARVMKAAAGAGLAVPADLAILGFDDLDMAEYMNISTIRQHLDRSGIYAAEILMDIIRSGHRERRTLILDLEIIERGSV